VSAEDDKIMQAAEEARRQKQQQQQQQQQQEQADVDAAHDEDGWGSMPGQLVKALDKKAQAKKKGKKAFFADAEGDAAVEVSVKTGPTGKVRDTGWQQQNVTCCALAWWTVLLLFECKLQDRYPYPLAACGLHAFSCSLAKVGQISKD
jgi:hypothetical protein